MDENLKIVKMLSGEQFYKELDHLVKTLNITYIDAAIHYCSKNDIEIEVAASLIKSNHRIKSAVQGEGEDLNFLPRTARLPI